MSTWRITENHLRMDMVPNVVAKVCCYCGNEFQSRARTVGVKECSDYKGHISRIHIVEYPTCCSRLCKRLLREEQEAAQ